MSFLILAALVVMLASLVGVVATSRHLGTFIERHLSALVSFSAGVFLIITYTLISETLTHASTVLSGLTWILVGILGIIVLFRLLPAFHHHHNENEEHHHSPLDARRILISDAIHNFGDGILLAAAFTISLPLGLAATVSIFLHEIVQEISEFFVLRQAGFTVRRALIINFAVSSTILIGAVGGFLLLDVFEHIEIPLLGLAAGALLVVVVHDLIPHSVRTSHKTNKYGKHIAGFLLGVACMFCITLITSGSHTHDAHDHIEEQHDEESNHTDNHAEEHHDHDDEEDDHL